MLQALRERCDRVGALLMFDEVQCGMGRTGAPFAANYHGVTPDMLTCAKALGNGFPVSALMLSQQVAAQIKYDDMGTTFGGGPMACAAVEAVIEAIESESLLANVRQVSAYIRAHCLIGPVTGVQGAGLLPRAQDLPARQRGASGAAGARHSRRGRAAIRMSCGCCPPTS